MVPCPPGTHESRAPARSSEAVEALLRELGPQLSRGSVREEPLEPLTTGIRTLDGKLGGGMPRGRLSEISGPASSGRTSLALALLAGVTTRGGVCAVVDLADALDPASVEAAGVRLGNVLWVRPHDLRQALRCSEHLLEASGFDLVLLDLAPGSGIAAGPSRAAWIRLSRSAASTGTSLVVLSTQRLTGSQAALALELAPAKVNFSTPPGLLEGLETRGALVRTRTPGSSEFSLRLHTQAA
ncbi:DNA recombination/repair protein RecA [Myxococcota bacterium]|nr:DNA recombination/repair protein RecA [Myxococcota bacterium]